MGSACASKPELSEVNLDNVKVIFPNGDKQNYVSPLPLSETLKHKSLSSADIIGLMVNGSVQSINSELSVGVAKIEPLYTSSPEGFSMYKRTLVKVFATAVHKLFQKEFHIIVRHHVNFGYLVNKSNEKPFTEAEVKKIKEKMDELIQQNLKIDEVELSHQEALNYFKSIKHNYSVALIETNNSDIVRCSCLDKFLSLLFRPLGRTTGVITDYDVRLSSDKNSLLLLFPVNGQPIPKELKDIETKLTTKSYADSFKYSKIINVRCVGDWNKVVISKKENTFSKKLGILLGAQGIQTIVISMDDYFVNRKDTPKDSKGNYDFECLEALRIDDFNRDLGKLFKGEEINRCVFDFVTGTYTYVKSDVLKLPDKDSGKVGVVLCEGLHGIDERVTPSIPRNEKFFIYIAPLSPINSDEYNFFADYVLRLYRRIIRDFRTRAKNASKTLKSWFSVAEGEEKYIYPFIDSSDLIWNSALDYEVSVLYPFVYPLLRTVDVNDPNYYLASYLMDTMSTYLPISDEFIEKTAVLREFIGGSSFE